MNIQSWFPLGSIDLISLMSKELSKSLLQHHSLKGSILWSSAFFMVQLSHLYMMIGKIIVLTVPLVGKIMSLLFNMLSRFVIGFLLRSKHLLIHGCRHSLQWFYSPRKENLFSASSFSPSICHKVMEPDAIILVFWVWGLKPAFPSPLSPSSRSS